MCKACSSLDGFYEVKRALMGGDVDEINQALGNDTDTDYIQPSYGSQGLEYEPVSSYLI